MKSICPGFINFKPAVRDMSFAPGGNMLEMSTRFVPAMPALRNAYSKLVSLSSCTPMPFVRKSFFATRSNKTFARKWINYLCLGTRGSVQNTGGIGLVFNFGRFYDQNALFNP